MLAFAQLFYALDHSRDASGEVAALEDYFRRTPPADAAWALWFLSGQHRKRAVKIARLRQWAAEAAGLPLWLVDECCEHVGDLGETLALLLPPNPSPAPPPLAELVEGRLLPLAGAPEAAQHALLRAAWAQLDTPQRLLWHKLVTGKLQNGVSRVSLVRALANLAAVEPAVMAHRLQNEWRPTPTDLAQLLSGASAGDVARPYPFFLAAPLEGAVESLGAVADWQVEWMWDGIRVQLIRRAGQAVLWSRGEEIITTGFPEIAEAARALPDGTVLDGELLGWRGEAPLPFPELQRRLNRRAPRPALCRAAPVVFMACDLLEHGGEDLRTWALADRRRLLETVLAEAVEGLTLCHAAARESCRIQTDMFLTESPAPPAPVALRLSPALSVASWDQVPALRRRAREAGAKGLMLKHRDACYGTGRQGDRWQKWKVAPFTCNAVLVAAQPGHGRRATLFTDYTFAVWREGELVTVAKACSGLTDDEIDAVDTFVRDHTTGRFGPVRTVNPELVFELAFEGIAPSTRHSAGVALRLARIARWRRDQPAVDADTLEHVRQLAESTAAA